MKENIGKVVVQTCVLKDQSSGNFPLAEMNINKKLEQRL